MPMLIDRRTFLAMAAVLASGIRANAAEDLTGIWSAVARTRGGLGPQFLFTPTEMTSTFGALVDARYEIDGSLFKMILGTSDALPPQMLLGRAFTIEGDRLTIAQGDAGPLVMTRVGSPHADAHPIVGDWTYMHQTGAPAVQRFSRSGAMQLAVAMQTYRGPYSIDNDRLTLRVEGRPAVTLTFKRESNILTTTHPNGRTIRYIKFEY